MFLVKFIKKEFHPSQDQNRFLATITLPLGVSINYTTASRKNILSLAQRAAEMNQYFASIGGFQGGAVNTETIFITMKHRRTARWFKIRPAHHSGRGLNRFLRRDKHRETQLEFMAKARKEFGKVRRFRVSMLVSRRPVSRAGYPVSSCCRARSGKRPGLCRIPYALWHELQLRFPCYRGAESVHPRPE